MPRQALFTGLVFDEFDRPLQAASIGADPAYVINDDGFLRHIPAEQIDNAILNEMKKLIQGNENLVSEQAAKMLGADDLFSKAMIANQLKNIDKQFGMLFETGIPEELRAYLGMTGFKVIVDYHGNLLQVHQAGSSGSGEDEGE
jgi:hypothetical protein